MALGEHCEDTTSPHSRTIGKSHRSQLSSSSSPSWQKDEPWRLVTKSTRFASKFHNGLVWPIHDLLATKLLSWILPTHPRTHLIKFCLVLTILLGLILERMGTSTQVFDWRDLVYMLALLLACGGWIYWYYQDMYWTIDKPWMDPRLPSLNRMEMHVPLRLFQDSAKARRAACLPQMVARNAPGSYTPNVILLDKHKWGFQLFKTVEEGLDAVHQDEATNKKVGKTGKKSKKGKGKKTKDSKWKPIDIPGHWMLQGFDDIPIYTNKKYPFPCKPPVVPKENPTGVYKLELDLPSDWILAGGKADQISILLHGFESICFVFWNGRMLGFGKDSRLPSEFVVPKELLCKHPKVHLVVARWSDGSYLEDQDHWWMAGLHRSVELVRRPSTAHILDYHVEASESKDLTVSIKLRQTDGLLLRVRLYNDKQLSSDGSEWEAADVAIWEMMKTEEKFSVVTFQDRINDVELWTAETPHLYTLVLEQVDSKSMKVIQTESCRVGFRSIRVSKGMLQVNSKPITVCGINRHEHDPDHGKVVSLDRMVQDIVVLKQNNFNAVRTAHYPNHSSFYRLCDYFGMYVCDEANVETDGMKPMGRLANDSGWENAFCSRVQRMVRRDCNHPCVIMWSLGNESGRGANLLKAQASIRELDNSRPICYEGGGVLIEGTGETELTDIVCQMYPDVEALDRLSSKSKDDRPIILCEYSHAMNNSNGNLHLYWEKFWDQQHPRLQGGFIWDMIDQGLRKSHKNGRDFFAYGGDFGDKINDKQFCINGMFSPERDPHPCVAEIKYLQQPAAITSEKVLRIRVDRNIVKSQNLVAKALKIKVTNRFSFIGLDHLSWKWSFFCESHPGEVVQGGTVLENGELRIDTTSIFSLLNSIDWHGCESGYLSVSGVLKSSNTWAEVGHVVVSEQLHILLVSQVIVREDQSPSPLTSTILRGAPIVSENDLTLTIESEDKDTKLVINKSSGDLMKMTINGDAFLCGEGVRSNFSRAATDNDKGGMELVLDFLAMPWIQNVLRVVDGSSFSYECHWREYGISQASNVSRKCTNTSIIHEKEETTIECDSVMFSEGGHKLMLLKLSYSLHKSGRIDIETRVTPRGWIRLIPSLARVGISLTLSPSFRNVSYFGRGPKENYPDRKAGAQLGLWETSPSKMGYDYIVPSENGNRSDCRWAVFRSSKSGVLIRPNRKKEDFCFSALLHSGKEFHHAKHTIDLEERQDGAHPIHVNLDHKQMGLGGDVSWFPAVYPQYLVECKKYSFGFSFLPVKTGESPEEVARRR